jgi:hypothetical protein
MAPLWMDFARRSVAVFCAATSTGKNWATTATVGSVSYV